MVSGETSARRQERPEEMVGWLKKEASNWGQSQKSHHEQSSRSWDGTSTEAAPGTSEGQLWWVGWCVAAHTRRTARSSVLPPRGPHIGAGSTLLTRFCSHLLMETYSTSSLQLWKSGNPARWLSIVPG